MNNDKFKAEVNYLASISVLKSMLEKEVISKEDFKKASRILMKKYRPILSGLCPKIFL